MALIVLCLQACKLENKPENDGSFSLKQKGIPSIFTDIISEITYDDLGNAKPEINYEVVGPSLIKIILSFNLQDSLQQDDWKVTIKPNFSSNFHWSPHLTPTNEHIAPQHVFRAPAVVMANTRENKQVIMMPDISLIKEKGPEWYMDFSSPENTMMVGWSKSKIKEHMLYIKDKGTIYVPGKHKFAFYLKATNTVKDVENPWRDVLSFYWDKYGEKLFKKGEPIGNNNLETYVKHTYNWAFNSWKGVVWEEFELNGKTVGAPTFIVNISQSPNYKKIPYEREFRSIWNQSWFSSLRSASGLFRYAKRTDNKELLKKAQMTKELALLFPQKEGFFPGLIATEMENVEIEGRSYARSKGWDTYYFGNSNRNPYMNDTNTEAIHWGDPKKSPYHILDMSWTAYYMLLWYDELEKDQRLLDFTINYADALLKLQDSKGYFPGWISLETLKPLGTLDQSPESSMSVTFLLKAYKLTGKEAYKTAALKCMDVILKEVVPVGRWEDHETYWSCSSYGNISLVNKKVGRNNMFKQSNLSIYWTSQALFNAYKLTGEQRYLKQGQRTLDELLMTQASWQPPYMYVKTLGGFGVMNADAEWNDSRQSIFAELIIKYGKELNNEEYIQRGLAALRSTFVMMYCPENPITKVQWEAKHSHFGPEDYGFMMENYGHNGVTSKDGLGIGVFTIYDWGNGAASEAYNRIRDHYGEDFILQ